MKKNKQRFVALSKVTLAVGLALSGAAALAADAGNGTDRIILKYRDSGLAAPQMTGPNAASARATVQAQRQSRVQRAVSGFGSSATLLREGSKGAQIYKLDRRYSLAEVEAMAAHIAKGDAGVEYAEPDRMKRHMDVVPNDQYWSQQWDLHNSVTGVNALLAWGQSTGMGVTVAVVDTGYTRHADLTRNLVSGGGYDMISDPAVSRKPAGRSRDAIDAGDWTVVDNECGQGERASGSSWHGTHVAGTVAATAHNAMGIVGLAYDAKILPVRVLGRCGGYTSDIADGMAWASGGSIPNVPQNTTPARVINLSLGGTGACSRYEQDAIDTARANGAVVVVAAGNDGMDVSTASPANCQGVVAVAALRVDGGLASYSNYGNGIDIAAPGGGGRDDPSEYRVGIRSTLNAGTTVRGADTYGDYSGTSMASPHVAAVAAMMIAAKPSLTPDQVESLLKSSARAFVKPCLRLDGRSVSCGTGMLDAAAAMEAVLGRPLPSAVEREPNNTLGTANRVGAPATFEGAIGSTSDQDWFVIDLPAGKTLAATLVPAASTADFDLYVYNSSGTLLGKSEKAAGQSDLVSVSNSSGTTAARYVKVLRYSTSPVGKYSLKLSW